MTTGGGWQDQVGGVFGGFNHASSAPALPLQVRVQPVAVPAGFDAALSAHLLLVHTGGSRLARDLLQNVVRAWYHRGAAIQQVGSRSRCVCLCFMCVLAFARAVLVVVVDVAVAFFLS